MAVSLPRKSNVPFERHVKHMAWFALVASLAMVLPVVRAGLAPELQLVVALGAAVIVVAIWMVVVSVPRYVRQQQVRAFDLAKASHLEGACQTAEAIQDRVANLLSITAGYAEFLVDDEQLSSETRQRAQQALDGALAAARVVSTFKEALGCHGRGVVELSETERLPRLAAPQARVRRSRAPRARWIYDASHRRVNQADGAEVATLATAADAATTDAHGQLIAAAPTLWQVVDEAQQLGAKILADGRVTGAMAEEIRDLLDHVNEVTASLDDSHQPT